MKGGRSRVVVTSKKTRRPSRRTCTRETGRAHYQRTAIIDAKSESTVDIAHASTPRAELHLPRVRRDSSRPEQTHTFQIGVGTPGHVCRCTVFFSRPFLRQVWCHAARPLRNWPMAVAAAPVDADCASACWSWGGVRSGLDASRWRAGGGVRRCFGGASAPRVPPSWPETCFQATEIVSFYVVTAPIRTRTVLNRRKLLRS